MKVSDRKSNLYNEKLGLCLAEPLHFGKMSVQFTSFDESHEEVNAEVILVNVVHAHNEGMLDTIEDIFLKF